MHQAAPPSQKPYRVISFLGTRLKRSSARDARNAAGKNRRRARQVLSMKIPFAEDNVIKIRLRLQSRTESPNFPTWSILSRVAAFRDDREIILSKYIPRTRRNVAIVARDFLLSFFFLFLSFSLPQSRLTVGAVARHRQMISSVNKRQRDFNKIAIRACGLNARRAI